MYSGSMQMCVRLSNCPSCLLHDLYMLNLMLSNLIQELIDDIKKALQQIIPPYWNGGF